MTNMMLAFNLSDERLSKLRFLCLKAGFRVIAVNQEDQGQPLSVLCGQGERQEAPAFTPFHAELLFFAVADARAVDHFLTVARQMRFAPVRLKAMLTPTNASWTALELYRELNAEHEAIEEGKTAHATRPDGKVISVSANESLQAAIDALPGGDEPITLTLAPAVYREKITLTRPNVTLLGAGAGQTRVTWADGAQLPAPDGMNFGTFRSYTLFIHAPGCTLRSLTVENTARREEAGQAIALFVDGDGFTCEDCALISRQDTLFTAPLPPKEVLKNGFLGPTQFTPRTPQRQVYRRCKICGDVDFIFGGAAAWFEDCDIVAVSAPGYCTAASTPEGQQFGYVFRHCRFIGECLPEKSMYLGRPWREYAKTILLECELGAHIRPEGWHDWGKPSFPVTGLYAEYRCFGPGAEGPRAPFARALTDEEAAGCTFDAFWASLKD